MFHALPRHALLVALALTACATASGQSLRADLPWRRPVDREAAGCLERGLELLAAGWRWEAARQFRELATGRPDHPVPRLGLALALRRDPMRAARLCWEAVERSPAGTAAEREIVAAYARYFGVASQPELIDPRFAAPPGPERAAALREELRRIGGDRRPAAALAARLLAVEAGREAAAVAEDAAADVVRCHSAWLLATGAMPFQVPGYRSLLAAALGDAPDGDLQLARLPRHPELGAQDEPAVGPLPGFAAPASAPLRWQPQQAPGFDLPRGLGGRGRYQDHAGQPLLVVFFLGFGCAHCVAQLADLDPKTARFRQAGIEVVSIGTDDQNQVKAAWQAALENGTDPLHFDVLCDPEGATFRRWGAWDEFTDEALHGTFLVDGQGRVLWRDVSRRPFEDSDFLLAECQRLLAAWR